MSISSLQREIIIKNYSEKQLSTTENTKNVLSSIPHCLQLQFLLASALVFLPNMGICLHSTSAVKSELCCHSPSVK